LLPFNLIFFVLRWTDDSSDDEPLSKFTNTRRSKKEEANPIEFKSSRRTNKKKIRTGAVLFTLENKWQL
jgi:hypothetical protein